MHGEGATSTNRALDLERGAMPLQHMLHDSQAETRAAGGARTPRIHPIEALGQTRDVLRRNTDARVSDGEVAAVIVDPPSHCDRAFGRRVFRSVVDEVRKCGMY